MAIARAGTSFEFTEDLFPQHGGSAPFVWQLPSTAVEEARSVSAG
jgi:hypothetical protein